MGVVWRLGVECMDIYSIAVMTSMTMKQVQRSDHVRMYLFTTSFSSFSPSMVLQTTTPSFAPLILTSHINKHTCIRETM